MRAKLSVLTAVLTLMVAYAAYPYVTLYRLGTAMRSGDSSTLEALVDWPAVREGIKEDICDLAADDDPSAKDGTQLPPFGASFVRGIASRTIDQSVTPQALVAAATLPAKPEKEKRGADVRVNWAFFDSPTAFMVSLRAPGQTEPIKLELDLQDGEWRVMRVWLPPELLSSGESKA